MLALGKKMYQKSFRVKVSYPEYSCLVYVNEEVKQNLKYHHQKRKPI